MAAGWPKLWVLKESPMRPEHAFHLVSFTALGHRLRSKGYSEAGCLAMVARSHPLVTAMVIEAPDGGTTCFHRTPFGMEKS